MTASYPSMLAAGDTIAGFDPFDLFAGDAPVVTQALTIATTQNLAQFTVLGVNTSGELVALDPTADYLLDADTVVGGAADFPAFSSKPVAILAQAINTAGGATKAPCYTSGFFNHEALVWPAALDTLAKRIAAVLGTTISVGATQRDA